MEKAKKLHGLPGYLAGRVFMEYTLTSIVLYPMNLPLF